jgi:DNA-binding transcriptional MerR regulator
MKWYDAKEVAATLNMTSRALRAYVRAGIFPAGVRGGRFWSQDDVDWMCRTLSLTGRLGMLDKLKEEFGDTKVKR